MNENIYKQHWNHIFILSTRSENDENRTHTFINSHTRSR